MPVRTFLDRWQEHRAHVHEVEEVENVPVPVGGSASSANTQTTAKGFNLGNLLGVTNSLTRDKQRSIEGGNSQSTANSNALTNAINLGGIPITNTVSNAHASSSSGSHTGSLGEMFQLGGLGLNAGVSNTNQGFGIDRRPGELGLHLGGLNFGLSNHGGLLGGSQAATQTQSNAGATATGQGAMSSASSQTQSNSMNYGLLNLQNTVSSANSQATSLNGATSANAGSAASTQGIQTPAQVVPTRVDNANPSQQNQYYQRPPGSFVPNPLNPFLGGNLFSNPYQQQYSNQQYPNPQQRPHQRPQQYPNQYQQPFPNAFQPPFNQYPNQYQQPYPNQQYSNQHGQSQRPFRPTQTNNQFDNPLGPFYNNYKPLGAWTPNEVNQIQNGGQAQPTPLTPSADRNSNSGLVNTLTGNNNNINNEVGDDPLANFKPPADYKPLGAWTPQQANQIMNGGQQQPSNTNSGLGGGFDDILKNPAPVTSAPPPTSPPSTVPDLGAEFQNILNGGKNPSDVTIATTTAKPYVENVDGDAPGAEYGLDVRIEEDDMKKMRRRRSPADKDVETESRFGGFGGFGGGFNPYQSGQENANANGFAQNQNPFVNQQSGANTHSMNTFNPFGNFQNNGASSIGSNIANDGLAGQVNAANTNQQAFQTAQGSGQEQSAQGQSVNYDQFGNLQTAGVNSNTQHLLSANGIRDAANSGSNAHLQNPFGSLNNAAQTNSLMFNENGL